MNSSSLVVAKASSVARRLRRLSSSTTSAAVATTPTIGNVRSLSMGADSNAPISTSSVVFGGTPFPATTTTTTTTTRRWFGSGGGNRGARGHGWWVNYRAGKGGRHLQGTYNHLDVDAMAEWNDAVFGMGSKLAYLDVKLESLAGADSEIDNENKTDNTEQPEIHRLTLELATEALPLATENVLKLIEGNAAPVADDNDNFLGYHSTTLHRIEKGVGILGGLVVKNPNHQSLNPNAPMSKKKMGMCHPSLRKITSPTSMDVSSEHLVVNHLEGVVTMLQPRIGEIDSRFLLLSHNAPHLDGVSVAIGRLATTESLEAIRNWESTLITSHGVPTNAVLKIVECGLLDNDDDDDDQQSVATETADSGKKQEL